MYNLDSHIEVIKKDNFFRGIFWSLYKFKLISSKNSNGLFLAIIRVIVHGIILKKTHLKSLLEIMHIPIQLISIDTQSIFYFNLQK